MEENKIQTETEIRTDSKSYNEGTLHKQLIHEEVNSAYNHHIIVKAYKDKRARDIAEEPHPPLVNGEKIPAIIIGSGPSLDRSIGLLRNWQGGILCTTSHARTLIRYGIQPTHIVALDPFCVWDEIDGIDWSKTRTKLICHPGVYPSLIENWPNEFILYLENMGDPNSFYSSTQKRMYTVREDQGKGIRDPLFRYIIRTSFALFACSPPLQLFAAEKLGYGTIFLCGCDFSYPDGKERFTEYTLKPEILDKIRKEEMLPLDPTLYGEDEDWNSIWEKKESPLKDMDPKRIIMTSNGIPSERIHVYYKKNFMSAWRLANKTIYTTDKGALFEVPFADINKVIKKQGLKFNTQQEWFIRKITDKYLSTVGCYVLEGDSGKLFIESSNPIEELANHMKLVNQNYFCPSCKHLFRITDDIEHEKGECPSCHSNEPGLVHNGKINIQENLERIKPLLPKTEKQKERPLTRLLFKPKDKESI